MNKFYSLFIAASLLSTPALSLGSVEMQNDFCKANGLMSNAEFVESNKNSEITDMIGLKENSDQFNDIVNKLIKVIGSAPPYEVDQIIFYRTNINGSYQRTASVHEKGCMRTWFMVSEDLYSHLLGNGI